VRKVYEHVGECPVRVTGLGWVRPKSGQFIVEMLPEEEAFFTKIGAIRVVREAAEGEANSDPKPDGPHAPREWTEEEWDKQRAAGRRRT